MRAANQVSVSQALLLLRHSFHVTWSPQHSILSFTQQSIVQGTHELVSGVCRSVIEFAGMRSISLLHSVQQELRTEAPSRRAYKHGVSLW